MLRTELRRLRLPPGDARAVAEGVFAYFRWKGCLTAKSLPEAVREAEITDREFGLRPDIFSEKRLRCAFPDWFFDEVSVSRDLLHALQSHPALWLRAKTGQGKVLAGKLGDCVHGREVPDESLIYQGDRDLFRTAEFHTGEFEIQDVASQLVGWLCAPRPGETWWDACAGEGGKTLHLADLMQNKGLIWASDRAEWRLRKLRQRAARAKAFNYRAALWDGRRKLPTKTRFDGVLIDAPCSGVGTWARNPHARWTVTPEDVRELSEVQRRLVLHAASAVKPGGKLIYSVCTLTRSETTALVESCSPALDGFEATPWPAWPNGLPAASGLRWIWPQDFGGNGMVLMTWRRVR